jgi:hypothetical protein
VLAGPPHQVVLLAPRSREVSDAAASADELRRSPCYELATSR